MANTQTTILKSSGRRVFPNSYWLQDLPSASLFAHSLTLASPPLSLSLSLTLSTCVYLSLLALSLLGALGFPMSSMRIKLNDILVDIHTEYSLGRNLTISWQLVHFQPCTLNGLASICIVMSRSRWLDARSNIITSECIYNSVLLLSSCFP